MTSLPGSSNSRRSVATACTFLAARAMSASRCRRDRVHKREHARKEATLQSQPPLVFPPNSADVNTTFLQRTRFCARRPPGSDANSRRQPRSPGVSREAPASSRRRIVRTDCGARSPQPMGSAAADTSRNPRTQTGYTKEQYRCTGKVTEWDSI